MDALIIDLLFSTDLSIKEIAIRCGAPVAEVRARIAALNLGWVRSHERMSRGHAALYEIMCRLFPGEDVVTEQPIGERLMLDVYCPKSRLAAEFHGQQHFVYTEHFHGDMDGFKESQRRDLRKVELCHEKGVTLVAFTAQEPMTEDYVFARLIEAMREGTPAPTRLRKVRDKSEYQLQQADRQRAYRKQQYQLRKRERNL